MAARGLLGNPAWVDARPAIVCGIDDSDGARQALAYAERLRARLGLRLVLVHAVPAAVPIPVRGGSEGPPVAVAEANTVAVARGVELLSRLARSTGEDMRFHCSVGTAELVLLETAERERAELVVLGPRGIGRLRTAVFGSVSSSVLAHARWPVVLVPPGASVLTDEPGTRTVVCGVDESGSELTAVKLSDRLARAFGATLVLVHVAGRPQLPGVSAAPGAAAELRRSMLEDAEALLHRAASRAALRSPFRARVVFGSAGGALADVAEEEDAELVVVGSRGRGRLKASLLGSVSLELLGSATRPVVVVRP